MNLKRVFLCIFAAVLLGGGLFLSCSNIFESEGEGGTSVSLSFSMKPGIRAAETGGETYKLVAELSGDAKSQQKEYQVSENETVNISFDDVSVGKTVRVLLRVYSGETLIYAGKSEEIKVRGGRNEATVTLKHTVLYVSGSGSNSDDNTGTSKAKAFKTLNRAFTEIGKTPSDDISWTIVVLGKVYSTSMMKDLEAKSITVVGEGSDAILDGRRENPEEGGTGAVFVVHESIAFDVTLSNLTIQNGQARLGAGVNARGKGTLTIENCVITNNYVISDSTGNASGGGLHVQYGTVKLVGTTITKNDSDYNGGGVNLANSTGTKLIIEENSKISDNTTNYSGGAINQNGGTIIMNGGEISKNTAKNNAGAVNQTRGDFKMYGGKITDNKADSYYDESKGKTVGGNGGGIYVNRGTFLLADGEISGNTAQNSGGAIYHNANPTDTINGETVTVGTSTIEITGGKIANNIAAGNGGAIYLRNSTSTLLMLDGEISGNTAVAKQGGGVYVDEGSFTMSGGKISNNKAGTQGGGIYTNQRSDTSTYGTFTMTGGSITENWATSSQKGGGIFNSGALALSGKITIANNNTGDDSYKTPVQIFIKSDSKSATLEYGSLGTLRFIFGSSLTVNLINGTFEDEEDESLKYVFEGEDDDTGGGTGTSSSSTYTSLGAYKTAFPNRGTETMNEDDFITKLNTATDGNTITLTGNVVLTKNFSTSEWTNEKSITIDCAGKYGIQVQASSVSVKNLTFKNGAGTKVDSSSEETRYEPFGTIYWSGSTELTFENCTFEGGTSVEAIGGGAIALFGRGKVKLKGCTFKDNSSTHGGAIDIGGMDKVFVKNCTFQNNKDGSNCDIYLGGSDSYIYGSGNTSDKTNPYNCYASEKNCDALFGTSQDDDETAFDALEPASSTTNP